MKKIVLILYFVSIINVYLLFGMLIKFSLINLESLKFLVIEYKNINFFYTLLVLSFVLLIFMIFFLIYLLLKRKRYKEHFSRKILILFISNFVITTSIFLILFFLFDKYVVYKWWIHDVPYELMEIIYITHTLLGIK